MLVGSHLSIAGGLHRAVEEALKLGLDSVQIFTRNQRQWKAKPLADQDIAAFKAAVRAAGWEAHPERRLVSHNSYLVNMASPSDEARARSLELQRDEIERCEALGVPSCVMHPGAHLGTKGNAADEEAGLRRLAAALDELHAALPGYRTITCLETTVGSGTNLGGPFEHLARVREMVKAPERVAVCFDTCHATAFGHDMSTPEKARAVWQRFDAVIGLRHLRVMHVNDSKGALGSRLDRHAHLGEGTCGRACFEYLARDRAFAAIPLIMETPKDGELRGQAPDVANAAWLRGCAEDAGKCEEPPRGTRRRGGSARTGGAAMVLLLTAGCLLQGGCRPWSASTGEYAAVERSLPAAATPEQQARMEAAHQVAQRGDYQQALEAFRDVLIENPRIPQAHIGVATVQMQSGDLRAAERAYEEALRIEPKNAQARLGLAQVYLQTGRPNEALQEFQRALVDAPGNRAAQLGIVQLLSQRGETSATLPFLRQLARAPDAQGSDWVRLGVACLASAQSAEAAEALEEALMLGEGGPDVLGPLAEAYSAQGRYGEAASTAEELARRMSTAAAWERVGWLQFRHGDYDRSAVAYRRATELEPTSARAWNGVAITALNAWLLSDRLDQAAREEARRAFQRSLELDPDQPAMVKLRDTYRP